MFRSRSVFRSASASNSDSLMSRFWASSTPVRSGWMRGQRQGVTTWSPLATTFNARPARNKFNAVTQPHVGLFNIPELRSHDGFRVMQSNVIAGTERLIDEAISSQRQRKMVSVFDELSDSLCKVADLAEFIRLAHPDAEYSQAATDACIAVSGVVEKLNTHRELYNSLRHSVDAGDIVPTTAMDTHVSRLFLFDFEQCGIHLPEAQRQRVVYLNEVILQLGQHFMNGAVQPRNVSKSVLPENIRNYTHNFTTEGDTVRVSGLYAESGSPVDREAAYRLYLYPDASQEHLLTQLIGARYELANTCDFPTYAHRAQNASTAETPSMVADFLQNLSDELRPRAAQDFATMTQMKRSDTDGAGCPELAAWDTPFYTAKYKKQFLQVSASEFQPYFSLGGCMEGLNTLLSALYGIRLENTDMAPGESWAGDIYKLTVRHDTEGELGVIYCDFFDRPGKPNQDCHFTIRGGKALDDGSYQNPVVVVMLSLSAPRWSGPTLLTPAMVDNLFHEMGHAMHSMLARTRYQHVTGTRCSTDFAEVPSVLMEYFASDPRVLGTFARHFQTQEPMPDEMLHRLCVSKNLFAASETQLQVYYSALDQAYHGDPAVWSDGVRPRNTTEVLRRVQEQFYGLPYVENTAWQLRFSHLVGYGAKYYSYLMSRAIASWIWHAYFKEDPFSRTSGERYRRECLAHGGAMPSRQLVAGFLGRDVSAASLTQSLIVEMDESRERIEALSAKTNG